MTHRRMALVIDDSPEDRLHCRSLLEHAKGGGWRVVEASSLQEGFDAYRAHKPQCVVLDYRLPGEDSMSLIPRLCEERGGLPAPVVVISGHGSEKTALRALTNGAQGYLAKETMTATDLARETRRAIAAADAHRRSHKEQRRLVATNEDLAGRNRTLETLHHAVSHEMRNALFTARESVALTLERSLASLTVDDRNDLDIALESCERMRRCVEDLLDVTRIETGKLSVHLAPTSLSTVVAHAADMIRQRGGERGVEVTCRVADGLPAVAIDRSRISQVMSNVLENALKYTPSGGRISVGLVAGSAEDGQVVTVHNTGSIIAPEDLARIFLPYFQVRSPTSPRGGLGLGLAISCEIIKLHGGRLRATSEERDGTRFTFNIPTATSC